MRDSLQPGYPSRFEVDKISVCQMALQPLDCRAIQHQLAVYLMALQPLTCRTVQCRVAEMPQELAHPIFSQCNRSRTIISRKYAHPQKYAHPPFLTEVVAKGAFLSKVRPPIYATVHAVMLSKKHEEEEEAARRQTCTIAVIA